MYETDNAPLKVVHDGVLFVGLTSIVESLSSLATVINDFNRGFDRIQKKASDQICQEDSDQV